MVGIVAYGVYIPIYRIKVEEIAKVWGQDAEKIKSNLLISEKSVASYDEDAVTLAVEASRNCLKMAGINPKDIQAIYVGSESHPYAVKPSGTIVAEAIGATPDVMLVDLEFACKAGTAAMQICFGLVKANMIKYGLAIGSDTAQSSPGDPLEYTAASGAAAFLIGKDGIIAELEGTVSYTTDTPDFWRRAKQDYPKHGGRFTGEPAYFKHIYNAAKNLMEKLGLKPSDFNHVVFHQPNGKFPLRVAKMLGFNKEQLKLGFIVDKIGNTYSASSLIGFCRVLDYAKPNERVLLVSYGSGAGSDAFSFIIKDGIEEKRKRINKNVDFYINHKKYIDYSIYVKFRNKLRW